MNSDEPTILTRARGLYRERRSRDRALGGYASLMGEPAWDMLLDLLIAHHEQRSIPALCASAGAGLEPGTGVRWIAILQELGLVERLRGEEVEAGRRVRLTPDGVTLMNRVIAVG